MKQTTNTGITVVFLSSVFCLLSSTVAVLASTTIDTNNAYGARIASFLPRQSTILLGSFREHWAMSNRLGGSQL
jgi:hypothetical protein